MQTEANQGEGTERPGPAAAIAPEPPSYEQLMSAIATFAPLIATHSDELEQDRRLVKPLVEALRASGFLRLWLPRELGGLEADPDTVFALIEAAATLDGSVGWNFVVAIAHGQFAGYLSEAAAQAIWGSDPDVIIATGLAPTGRAVEVAGGYRVSGRWSFASGIRQADWLCGCCVVYDGDRPQLGADGDPGRFVVLFPATEAEILDTWHTGGLRGTGSHDFTVSDVFVPAGYGFDLARTPGRSGGPLYRQPFLAGLNGVVFAAVALGIARHAVNAFIQLAAGKMPAGRSRVLLRDRPLAQLQVAQADAQILAARAFLLDATRQAWFSIVEHGAPTELEMARVKLATVHAGESSLKATELMHRAGGSSAVYSSSALDRCLRDVHAASQHVHMSPEWYLSAGAVLLDQAGGPSLAPAVSSQ